MQIAKILEPLLVPALWTAQFFHCWAKIKIQNKFGVGLVNSKFQNGMSWSHITKTLKQDMVNGIGLIQTRCLVGGGLGVVSPTQLQNLFINTENFSLIHVLYQKLFHFFLQTDTRTHILPSYMKGLDISLNLSLKYVCFVSPYLHWQNTFATYSLGSKWSLIGNVIGASFID